MNAEQPSRPHPSGFADASGPVIIALTVRFLLELALLAGVAVLGWTLIPGWWAWPAAAVAVITVATIWGLFLSPKARIALPRPGALGLEALLFVGTCIGLFTIDLGVPAVIGVTAWAIDRAALALLQR